LRSAARPGHSEHQLGTTIDVEGGEAWLASNAWRYGFVMSYPPEHSQGTTCYKPEAWHFRYVGRDAARAIRESGLSLRAWLWKRQSDR
jgi:D-alanyl-D-alanine carboxypeptidase